MRPLSIVNGRDKDVIPLLMQVHAPFSAVILDATYNRGVMWKGSGYEPTKKLDIEPLTDDTDQGDFMEMPYDDETFDVVAFDPPHLPTAIASPGSSGIERVQYGLTNSGDWRSGDNIVPGFYRFMQEAKRVLRPNGIVIAKISDLVHNHKYQWQHVDFVVTAREVGLTPCDVIVKADPAASNLKSSKWKQVRHFRRAHCFWIVLRKGRCERPVSDGGSET
jgi:SAM-dependent methyltransferase